MHITSGEMRWRNALLLAWLALPSLAVAQAIPDSVTAADSAMLALRFLSGADTLVSGMATNRRENPPHVDRCPLGHSRLAIRAAVAAAFVGANLDLHQRFKQAWWSGERAPHFFFNADWGGSYRDQDKLGHLYGGYHLTRAGHTLLRSACVSEKKAVLFGAIYATLFQLQIELWDGRYAKYGFSYPDLLANTTGMALGVLHAVSPRTQVVKPTISYRQTAAMKEREGSDEIRYSTDYSGQTYWVSLDVDAALPSRAREYWPGILRFSLGHSITDYVLPRVSGAPAGTPQPVVFARRRLLLSLDLDAGKLPGNNPLWRFVKRQVSFIRLPAPALQIAPELALIGWYR